jgi:hypothetical protein
VKRLIVGAWALLAVACVDPSLNALTVPPLGKQALLDSEARTITLSRGVALGFDCALDGPCADASATVDDGNLALVLPAYLDDLGVNYTDGLYAGSAAKTGFVLVGKVEGRTKLRVKAEDVEVEYDLEILR